MSNNPEPFNKGNNKGDANNCSNYSQSFDEKRSYSTTKPEESRANIAGPFGDSPPETTTSNNNYFVFMMSEAEEKALDAEDAIMREYLLKLGAIQERLQMMQIIDLSDSSNNYENGMVSDRETCKITEIFDNETSTGHDKPNYKVSSSRSTISSSKNTVSSINPDIEECVTSKTKFCPTDSSIGTSHSSAKYTPVFNFTKEGDVTLCSNFEMEYDPPKKRHCIRDTSPKVHSISSEGYMKYPFFKRNTELCSTRSENRKLLDNKQWNDEDNNSKEKEEKEENVLSKNKSTIANPGELHIYPNIIVKTSEDCFNEETIRNAFKAKGKLLEIDGTSGKSSGCSYEFRSTTYTSSAKSEGSLKSFLTTMNTSGKSSKHSTAASKNSQNEINTSAQMTIWEEIRKSQVENEFDKSEFDLISGRSSILKDESIVVEKKKSITDHLVGLFKRSDKSVINFASSAVDESEDNKDVRTNESAPKDLTDMSGDPKFPSVLLENFRKSQLVEHFCYAASSSHSARSEREVEESHSKIWKFCSCFCAPFSSMSRE